MIEFEKKMLLSKDEYEYLIERFDCKSHSTSSTNIKQINYYFDTDDFSMNRKNITCRIRLKNGKYKATMKQHSSNSDKSTETEMEIYDGLKNNAFTNMGLKLQGSLSTDRYIILKDFNYNVVLDKNEYLGHKDYELEIEYTPEYEKNAKFLLQMFQNMLMRRKCFLAYQERFSNISNVPNKANRFFDRKAIVD